MFKMTFKRVLAAVLLLLVFSLFDARDCLPMNGGGPRPRPAYCEAIL